MPGATQHPNVAENPAGHLAEPHPDRAGRVAPAVARKSPPVAQPARMRKRHFGLMFSFMVGVVGPLVLIFWYLFFVANDQYASRVGFSVRSEEMPTASDVLGGLGALSTGTSSDSDVLYEFIQSQQLVATINARINLKALYSKPVNDPVYAFDATGKIEDLLRYWQRMVKIDYDSGTGLIELRVNAFSPEDAQLIAREIFSASSAMINDLSAIAREDATGYAKVELAAALERLKAARQALTRFRSETQIVDPTADVQGQMGLLTTLQTQLAQALIELDLLRDVTRDGDPRIAQSQRRIAVIQNRISEERKKIGLGESGTDAAFSNLVGQYEALVVDREFAEQTYLSARVAYDLALAEANRKSRYLAAYVRPTLAESSEFPRRLMLLSLYALFLCIGWAILVLVGYSIRDRR